MADVSEKGVARAKKMVRVLEAGAVAGGDYTITKSILSVGMQNVILRSGTAYLGEDSDPVLKSRNWVKTIQAQIDQLGPDDSKRSAPTAGKPGTTPVIVMVSAKHRYKMRSYIRPGQYAGLVDLGVPFPVDLMRAENAPFGEWFVTGVAQHIFLSEIYKEDPWISNTWVDGVLKRPSVVITFTDKMYIALERLADGVLVKHINTKYDAIGRMIDDNAVFNESLAMRAVSDSLTSLCASYMMIVRRIWYSPIETGVPDYHIAIACLHTEAFHCLCRILYTLTRTRADRRFKIDLRKRAHEHLLAMATNVASGASASTVMLMNHNLLVSKYHTTIASVYAVEIWQPLFGVVVQFEPDILKEAQKYNPNINDAMLVSEPELTEFGLVGRVLVNATVGDLNNRLNPYAVAAGYLYLRSDKCIGYDNINDTIPPL
jgi:hypothetical protein